KGSIFAQRASEIRYCVELIYSISIGANLTQTTPIEIGSKATTINTTQGVIKEWRIMSLKKIPYSLLRRSRE
ncbi:hypothetical protein, partial [Vibrio campbellii]